MTIIKLLLLILLCVYYVLYLNLSKFVYCCCCLTERWMCAVSGTALYVAGLTRRVRTGPQRSGRVTRFARHTGHRSYAVRWPALHHAGIACPRILDPGVHVAAAIRDAACAATPFGPDRRMRYIYT